MSDTAFLVECPACGRRELRGLSGLTSLENTPTGIVLRFACRGCGAEVQLATGRRRRDRQPA